MEHSHSHEVNHTVDNLKRSFFISIGLNLTYAVGELISGMYYGSMSMISDAGHNFVDVFSLILAYAGLLLAGIKANKEFTFGYKKATVIAAVINSVFLIISVLLIVKESIFRIFNPVDVNGFSMIIIACLGIIINGFTGWIFHKDQHKDLNIKAAFLHLMADALISLGVVISGFLILFTGWTKIDPIFSIIIAIVIVFMTLKMLKDSIKMAIDGVPKGIDIDEISNEILKIESISGIHHVHIWSIGTSESSFTAHIQVSDGIRNSDFDNIKSNIREILKKRGILHSTLEFEFPGEVCKNQCSSC
jgi:cobalt-zinc-cadmium efflux system protein